MTKLDKINSQLYFNKSPNDKISYICIGIYFITKPLLMKKSLKRYLVIAILCSVFTSIQAQDEAMNYKDLQGYLPTSLSGYTAGDLGGSSMNMQGMSFSNADIAFTNDSGDEVVINLMDYSGAASMFQAATAMWASGMSFEDDESKAWALDWSDNIKGWAVIEKKSKKVQIALGIGERFFLSIEATNKTDISFVEDIAKGMKLEELAGK